MAMKLPNIWPFRRRSASPVAETTPARPTLHPLTSEAYETSHSGIIDIAEASRRSSKARGPKNLSMAWDDDYLSLPGSRVRDGGMLSERDRKDTYYKAYLANPWVRACIEAIAKRFTSGKWELEETEQGKGSQANYDKLSTLLMFVNEDEDFKQFLRSIAVDLGIFGEAFAEVVYANGVPVQLHKIDCATMNVQFDRHGQAIGYTQTLERSTETVDFTPEQIIRWWLPDPRASKKALSPIECMKDSVYLYQAMITWGEKFFKQGGRPVFSIEMGEDSNIDDANRYLKFFRENYLGIQNAHTPPVFYGGAKLIEFGKGSIELDFLHSLSWCRDEILAGFNVPLNVLGIQESAHLGGGSGESSNKIFVYNTVKPLEQLILEKFNYRLVNRAFRIQDWAITVSHADYRDDQEISKVQDTQIRNGSLTINEARQERGREPVKGGDEAVIVASRDILPVERNAEIADEQRAQAQLSLQNAQASLDQRQQQNTQDTSEEPPNGNAPSPKNSSQGNEAYHDASRRASQHEAYDTSRDPRSWRRPSRGDTSRDTTSCDQASDRHSSLDTPRERTAYETCTTPVEAAYTSAFDTPQGSETPRDPGAHQTYQAPYAKDPQDQIADSPQSQPASTYQDQASGAAPGAHSSQSGEAFGSTPQSARGASRPTRPFDAPHRTTQDDEAPAHDEAYSETRGDSPCEEAPDASGDTPQRETQHSPRNTSHNDASSEAQCAQSSRGHSSCLDASRDGSRDSPCLDASQRGPAPRGHQPDVPLAETVASQHWQDDDSAIKEILASLQAEGVKTVTWHTLQGACNDCMQNHNVTVPLGKRFPSGAYLTPQHNHCNCVFSDDAGQHYAWADVDGLYKPFKGPLSNDGKGTT